MRSFYKIQNLKIFKNKITSKQCKTIGVFTLNQCFIPFQRPEELKIVRFRSSQDYEPGPNSRKNLPHYHQSTSTHVTISIFSCQIPRCAIRPNPNTKKKRKKKKKNNIKSHSEQPLSLSLSLQALINGGLTLNLKAPHSSSHSPPLHQHCHHSHCCHQEKWTTLLL